METYELLTELLRGKKWQELKDILTEMNEQDIAELGNVLKTRNGVGHDGHAVHEGGEAQQDHACVLLLAALGKQEQGDTDKGKNGGKGGGLEHLQNAAAFDTGKAEYPCGDGGTDVGTHDDVDGLLEGHQTGVYKADDHDGGGGRALDDGGHADTGKKAGYLVRGQLA